MKPCQAWPTAAVFFLALRAIAGADDTASVATIGKQSILARDLDARANDELKAEREGYELHAAQLERTFERNRQAYLEKELNSLVDERVLALEAAARKSTPAALTAALEVPVVTDAQTRRFYDANKARISQPYESAAPQIREYLQEQDSQQAQRRYLDALRDKYRAVITLEPLREPVAATGPVRGPADAPVTIIEFSDFQCPYCGRFMPTLREILAKYPTQVRLVYRHFPLASLHPNAQKAAEAAVCAEDQGKFWEMYDLLFQEQNALEVNALKDKAKRLGLDTASFDECLDSGKSRDAVRRDSQAAEQLAISGTPTSFVNGRFVGGTVSAVELSQIIDDELRRAEPAARR
ncbi:MAG TPA: thioredoxin domain-containing protein [Steroidobacteraceae bacterium]|nr:thioredoxin domain-containing protein [Steroidobacteraceae bacterium]